MKKKKKKIQEPMMKRINKPFEEVLERLVKTDPKEVDKEKSGNGRKKYGGAWRQENI